MKKTLCIYYSRTGLTAEIMQSIAQQLDAELVSFTDGRNYDGVWGYLKACAVALSKNLPRLKPFVTERPMSDYETVIVGVPVWVEAPSVMVKAFLKENGRDIRGKLCYVVTHMSPISYEKKILDLARYAGRPCDSFLSVQTRKHDWKPEAAAFAEKIR